MSWNEFKAWVDEQLEAQGISPDAEIFYIDTYACDIHVALDDQQGIMIS